MIKSSFLISNKSCIFIFLYPLYFISPLLWSCSLSRQERNKVQPFERLSCTTKTTGNQSTPVCSCVMCLGLFIWALHISKGKSEGEWSGNAGGIKCIEFYIYIYINSLIRAMALTYILNRAFHSIIWRNKSHLSNSCLQMSQIKINQSIFWAD